METFLTQLKNNWVILSFVAYLIVSSTTDKLAIAQAQNDIEQLSEVVSNVNEININMAIMATDINYIKESHVRLENALKK